MISVPEAFKQYPQFIMWKAEILENGKIKKVPIRSSDLRPINPHNPSNWLNYNDATALLTDSSPARLGFVFTKNDPFFFFDIDGALIDGTWSPATVKFCADFAGCAIEVSCSGTGLHIFGVHNAQPHSCDNTAASLGFYTELRFVALTGTGLTGDSGFQPADDVLNQLISTHFTPAPPPNPEDWTDKPVLGWHGPEDDLQLLDRMLKSKSASNMFGGKASVVDLWSADADALSKFFPPSLNSYSPFDHSSADAALCAHLAFWTGRDCERIDRLFRMSGLMREKWDRGGDYYSRRTILRATAGCDSVLGRGPTAPQNPKTRPAPGATDDAVSGPTAPAVLAVKTGYQFKHVDEQPEYFKGCVYVRDLHRALTPDGALLKPEQFRAMYGGYLFAIDSTGAKSVKNAWEVFTESQAYDFPKAHAACFRPECKPGEIINEGGEPLVNTYVPAVIRRVAGDPTPFLELLKKLLPNNRDRQILTGYMAACTQYIGRKFQWTPLLQGIQGNGKTLLLDCVSYATGRKYTHLPNAGDLGNKFNAWILGKLFIGVEEVCTKDKQEVIEALKPLITNSRLEIQGKGADQSTGDNRANFMMCTNHKDAIRLTKGDRRYCVFYTAQQKMADMKAAGMLGRYFPDLYRWLRADGYAIVADYLLSYNIPYEFDPTGACESRAPATSSMDEVLQLSMGGLEQEVDEAVAEGRYGFGGGWLSSLAFNQLIKDRKDERRIPPNKRRQIIAELGYIPHPALPGGRVNSIIAKDGGKPVLYLREGHPGLQLTGVKNIAAAYQKDQETI